VDRDWELGDAKDTEEREDGEDRVNSDWLEGLCELTELRLTELWLVEPWELLLLEDAEAIRSSCTY
jgi:hypothetical protein